MKQDKSERQFSLLVKSTGQVAAVWILILPLTSCMTLGELLKFSVLRALAVVMIPDLIVLAV